MKKIFFITILLLVGLCKINALDQQNMVLLNTYSQLVV